MHRSFYAEQPRLRLHMQVIQSGHSQHPLTAASSRLDGVEAEDSVQAQLWSNEGKRCRARCVSVQHCPVSTAWLLPHIKLHKLTCASRTPAGRSRRCCCLAPSGAASAGGKTQAQARGLPSRTQLLLAFLLGCFCRRQAPANSGHRNSRLLSRGLRAAFIIKSHHVDGVQACTLSTAPSFWWPCRLHLW